MTDPHDIEARLERLKRDADSAVRFAWFAVIFSVAAVLLCLCRVVGWIG